MSWVPDSSTQALGRFRAVLLGLSTGHEVGLALVAGVFVAFALFSSLVIPRWRPEYPGRRLRLFVLATLVLFVATLGAVEVFAKESETAKGGEAAKPGTTQAQPPPTQPKGDPAAGKAIFLAQGCASCHTFSLAGATGTVGPNLDVALKGKSAAFIRESIVDPNKQIAPDYPANVMPQNFGKVLTPKQIDNLVAFLMSG
jgi:mono/diheme cytochrome c family protein